MNLGKLKYMTAMTLVPYVILMKLKMELKWKTFSDQSRKTYNLKQTNLYSLLELLHNCTYL